MLLDTLINQLNFGYQKDLKDEQTRFEWFFILMANFYKSDTFDLTTTNLTTVLTINASSIAIVRAVQTCV
jgi:hypothetical protein